ncbi:MAG TPA: pyridoxal-phosphate dependent enzyme [Gaiella sp.]|uniref:threonine ammonia-lyase n=1 Tax=Gaiella sp. TaxID=2663207 RepID=UPI002D7FE618|nr:pyridoxal-phosphate dependent enzyme [Gaiella sp.]HET9286308.1 pyridoxal-phosphate dependent enzyme [Gaiella sp.]
MSDEGVTRDDVVRAAETIRGRVRRTPLLDAAALAPGLALKAELFQHTGSFKARGVTNRLAALSGEERRRGVAGVSAGNHAIALAWGAAGEDLDCIVFSWESASPFKLDRARSFGATVDTEAEDPSGAFVRLEEHLAETGATLVHPFDDPLVVAGQGTVGLEILEDEPRVDVIVVPVGGGGLVSGITVAAASRGARIVAVEPEGSPALARGLEAGKPVAVVPRTIAGGLDAPFAGRLAIEICRTAGVEVVTVGDEEIEEAMRRLYADAKLACEPAGAAGVAAVLAGRVDAERMVAVVSGGNVGPEIASGILASR